MKAFLAFITVLMLSVILIGILMVGSQYTSRPSPVQRAAQQYFK